MVQKVGHLRILSPESAEMVQKRGHLRSKSGDGYGVHREGE